LNEPSLSVRSSRAILTFAVAILGLTPFSFARDAYDPPAGYYAGATGTGVTLESALHVIVSGDYFGSSFSHRVRSYGDARDALQILDQDPLDASKIVLFYTGNSVDGTWDQGATWNREHTWPRSRGVDSSGPDNSDLHMLRPCNPSVNSSRGNRHFGIGSGYWDPLANAWVAGVNHRGEAARGCFYAQVRYDGVDAFTTGLTLAAGAPGGNSLGDLTRLLEWHYSDPVDERERRRNHLIFSNADNPGYYQGNRNPFVDHPEFVWAIWGPTPNDSTLYVGLGPDADGTSGVDLVLRAIEGALQLEGDVAISKIGATPTTYDVIAGADLEVEGRPTGRTFISGARGAIVEFRVPGPLAPGLTFTALTIDNTDLTSAGAGMGAGDGDDVVSVTIDVLTHGAPSFDASSIVGQTLISVDVPEGAALATIEVPLHNVDWGPGQAALDVTGVTGLSSRAAAQAPFPALITDSPQILSVGFDPSGLSAGAVVNEAATIELSEEYLPGALGHALTLGLSISIVEPPVGCDGDADLSGVVAFGDLTAVFSAWQTSPDPGEPGDADGSGFVDFADITMVLNRWGVACAE